MKNVIIIGAGPAGLTAAYELLKKDKDAKVTILEESDAIGGISRTVRYKGNRMDIGGHRFFSKDENVMKWWTDLVPMQGSPSMMTKNLVEKKLLHLVVLTLKKKIELCLKDTEFQEYTILKSFLTTLLH